MIIDMKRHFLKESLKLLGFFSLEKLCLCSAELHKKDEQEVTADQFLPPVLSVHKLGYPMGCS